MIGIQQIIKQKMKKIVCIIFVLLNVLATFSKERTTLQMYRKHAKSGNPYYMRSYAEHLLYEKTAKDTIEANKWLNKALEKEFKNLEWCKKNLNKRRQKSFSTWRDVAFVEGTIGHIYYMLGDMSNAMKYLLKAGNGEDLNAQRDLVEIYTKEKKWDQVVYWLTKQEAWFLLGIIYYDEKCGMQNYNFAYHYFKAAESVEISIGLSAALSRAYLGIMLYKGLYNGKADYEIAFAYLKEGCADKDCPAEAMRVLSACYRYGLGTNIDLKMSEHWLNEAANRGDDKAIEILMREWLDKRVELME
ncbi:MAG: sel1 repeat family protein [Prevotella sp.]|nr:sel1 repeat family protein [Prevotella sp.]